MREIVEELLSYMEQGGFVMWPLLAVTLALWFGIAYRFASLRRGAKGDVRLLVNRYQADPDSSAHGFVDTAAKQGVKVRRSNEGDIRRFLDDELFGLAEDMRRYRTLVRTLVLVAPLAGLLGTVSGMIEMFESLGDQTFFSQSGGVANGISQALFTTQFGLVIAVPGMVVGRLLDRHENTMREEIEQIKDLLNCEEREERAS